MATKRKAATKKKATTAELTLEEGQYFTATYNRKHIRGIVSESCGCFNLYNATSGEENDDGDYFGYSIFIDCKRINQDTGGLEDIPHNEALANAGVNNFQVVKDKATIKQIEGDKMPKIAGYPVRKSGEYFIFGCGAIEVTKKEIANFLQFTEEQRKLKAKYCDIRDMDGALEEIEDTYGDIQRIAKYALDKEKLSLKAGYSDFEELLNEMENQGVELEQVDENDVKLLLTK